MPFRVSAYDKFDSMDGTPVVANPLVVVDSGTHVILSNSYYNLLKLSFCNEEMEKFDLLTLKVIAAENWTTGCKVFSFRSLNSSLMFKNIRLRTQKLRTTMRS